MRPRLLVPSVLSLLLVLLMAPPAAAFPLEGCTLTLTSLDAAGQPIDTAIGGAADATQADPLLVDWDGTVNWSGTMGSQVIRGHTWHVDVFGIPTPLRGDDPNADGETEGADWVTVSENAPFRFTGLFHVTGSLRGEGGSCSGSGWLKLAGEPLGTVPFFVGLALLVVGLVLLAVGRRGRWASAIGGGLLSGIGAAMLLVTFGILPLGAITPLACLALGLAAGAIAVWWGHRSLARPR
jgi:hypothetical protein